MSSVIIALTFSACADSSVATNIAETDPFLVHRWQALGAVIFLGLLQLFILTSIGGIGVLSGEFSARSVLGGIFSAPLGFSILGEFWYNLAQFIANFWSPLVQGGGALTGLSGNTSFIIFTITVLGFVLTNPPLFYLIVIPSLIGLVAHLIILISAAFLSSSKET